MHSYDTLNKIKFFFYIILVKSKLYQLTLFEINGFLASFVRKENFLHFFNYIKWDEEGLKSFKA